MVTAELWDDDTNPRSGLPFRYSIHLHDERPETPSPVEPLVNDSRLIAAWIHLRGAR